MNIKRLRTEIIVAPAGALAIAALVACGIFFWVCALNVGKKQWVTTGRNKVSRAIMDGLDAHGLKVSICLWALIFVGIILKTAF